MRVFVTFLLSLSLALALPSPLHGQALTKLNIGYPPANDFIPLFAATDNGFFKKHGIEATITPQRVVTNIPVALNAGALDLGGLPPSLILGARQGGLDLVALQCISHDSRSHPIVSLFVKKGGPIKTASDLQGKKVGVPGLYAGIDLMLRQWLIDKKVPLSSVTFVEVPFPEMANLLDRGSVDAVAAIEPTRSRLAAGNATNLSDYPGDLVANICLITWATTKSWADSHREVIGRFRTAMAEARAFVESHPDEADALQKKYLNFSGPHGNFTPALTTDDFLFYANAMRAVGILRQPVDFSKLIYR